MFGPACLFYPLSEGKSTVLFVFLRFGKTPFARRFLLRLRLLFLLSRLLPRAHFDEEGGKHARTLLFEHAAHNFHLMVEKVGVCKRFGEAPALLLICAEIDALYPRVQDGAHAHGAGFERDVELGFGQPPGMFLLAGAVDGAHFGVRRRHLQFRAEVIAPADDLPVQNDDGADGDLPFLFGAFGEFNGFPHEFFFHRYSFAARDAARTVSPARSEMAESASSPNGWAR